MLTLQEKRNRKSREYITKLGFDQHPDLNRAGTSCVTAHLESQLGKGPRQRVCSVGEASKTAGQGSCLSSQDGSRLIAPSICDQIATLLMWMLCVLSWKTWNVAKPEAWLARPRQDPNNLKIPSPSYLRCCKSWTPSSQSLPGTPSQDSVQAG